MAFMMETFELETYFEIVLSFTWYVFYNSMVMRRSLHIHGTSKHVTLFVRRPILCYENPEALSVTCDIHEKNNFHCNLMSIVSRRR